MKNLFQLHSFPECDSLKKTESFQEGETETMMKIIISPAKKMNRDLETLEYRQLPQFIAQADKIAEVLRTMNYEELKSLWKCNDQIARLNFERIQDLNLRNRLTPAILSYEGIQYQYMAPAVFETQSYSYIEEHLRILSGFYGILRPFDGIVPYRLEMQAKLCVDGSKNLYDFWKDSIAETLFSESDCILNLASKEYSKCVEKYIPKSCGKGGSKGVQRCSEGVISSDRCMNYVTCVFGELIDGKVKEKGTYAKMARGEMVRFMAQNQIEDLEGIKEFHSLDYQFSDKYSDETTYIFLR